MPEQVEEEAASLRVRQLLGVLVRRGEGRGIHLPRGARKLHSEQAHDYIQCGASLDSAPPFIFFLILLAEPPKSNRLPGRRKTRPGTKSRWPGTMQAQDGAAKERDVPEESLHWFFGFMRGASR